MANQDLETFGYILHPGFAQTAQGEKCSPLTHVSTVYDGDKSLTEIIKEITDEKNKLPEITVVEVEVNPDDWNEQPDGSFEYDYTDSILNDKLMTEVQADKENMKKIVNDKIRWALTEDIVGNTVPIFIQKKPTQRLILKLLIYSKYIKIPLSIQEPNWEANNVSKEYLYADDVILASHLALFRLDRTNINKFLDNNYSITKTKKGEVTVYTDNAVSLDSQVILLDTGLTASDLDDDNGGTGGGTSTTPSTPKDDKVGDVLTAVQRCNLTGSLKDYEISENVVEKGMGEYVNALPNLHILKSKDILITDTNNSFEDFDSTYSSYVILKASDFTGGTFSLSGESLRNFSYVAFPTIDYVNGIFAMVSFLTPYANAQTPLVKDSDDIYKLIPFTSRIFDTSNVFDSAKTNSIKNRDSRYALGNNGFFGWIKEANSGTEIDDMYNVNCRVTNLRHMNNNIVNNTVTVKTNELVNSTSDRLPLTDQKKLTIMNEQYDSISTLLEDEAELKYIINPSSGSYDISQSQNKQLLSNNGSVYYIKYCSNKSLGGIIKSGNALLYVNAMQTGYLQILEAYADINQCSNTDISNTTLYSSLSNPSELLGSSYKKSAIELRTSLEFGNPSCFNSIVEKNVTYIGHDNGLILVLDNTTLDVIYSINIKKIIIDNTDQFYNNYKINTIDWFDDNCFAFTCEYNPYVYCINKTDGSLVWAHNSGISEGLQVVSSLNQSVYFCYRNKDDQIRLAEWKKFANNNNSGNTNTSSGEDPWRKVLDLPTNVMFSRSCVLGDKIYIIGGLQPRDMYIFDGNNLIKSNIELPYPFMDGCVIGYDGKIHMLGGSVTDSKNLHYTFDGTKWEKMNDLPYDFTNGSVVSTYNTYYNTPMMYLVGGTEYNTNNKLTTYYNNSGKYEVRTHPVSFKRTCSVYYNDDLHILGGQDTSKSHYYNGSLYKLEDIPYQLYGGDAVVYNDKIHIFGGGGGKRRHYSYDGNSWTREKDLNFDFDWNCMVIYDNKLYAITDNAIYTL
jgi:hypothetical protein